MDCPFYGPDASSVAARMVAERGQFGIEAVDEGFSAAVNNRGPKPARNTCDYSAPYKEARRRMFGNIVRDSRVPAAQGYGAQYQRFQSFIAMLRSLATLLVFQCLGEGVSQLFGLPVPGPVIGMLLLLGFLSLRPQVANAIEPTALELLRHLSLLFVPAGVGIMASAYTIRGSFLAVATSIVVSTSLAIAVTALVTRTLLRRQRGASPTQEPST